MMIDLKKIDTICGVLSTGGEFALGNILVANGHITQSQLDEALRRQIKTGRHLGEELIMAGHTSKGQVEVGLLLQRKLIAYALAASVGMTPLVTLTSTAEAAQTSTALHVSVTVIANVKINTRYQATQLYISKADVARGYVEVPAASRFDISSNSRSGYLLEFHPLGNLFESVHVGGLSNAVQLDADGGVIVQRGSLPQNLTHELSFRFILSADAQPGSYLWPLQMSVRPL